MSIKLAKPWADPYPLDPFSYWDSRRSLGAIPTKQPQEEKVGVARFKETEGRNIGSKRTTNKAILDTQLARRPWQGRCLLLFCESRVQHVFPTKRSRSSGDTLA